MSDVFDANALMDRVDGDIEFLEETIAMLNEDSPALLEQIQAAASAGDAAALVRSAHGLKGMLGNFCTEQVETTARELELRGREGRLSDIDADIVRVKDETARLIEALHQFLRTQLK